MELNKIPSEVEACGNCCITALHLTRRHISGRKFLHQKKIVADKQAESERKRAEKESKRVEVLNEDDDNIYQLEVSSARKKIPQAAPTITKREKRRRRLDSSRPEASESLVDDPEETTPFDFSIFEEMYGYDKVGVLSFQ